MNKVVDGVIGPRPMTYTASSLSLAKTLISKPI